MNMIIKFNTKTYADIHIGTHSNLNIIMNINKNIMTYPHTHLVSYIIVMHAHLLRAAI